LDSETFFLREPIVDPSGPGDITSIYPALTGIFLRAFRILLFFAGVGVAAYFYRMLTQPGWRAAFALYAGLYLVAALLFALRRRFSLSFVFSALLVIGYTIGAVVLWTGGLAATGIMHLAMLCVFASVLLGMRAGIVALFAGAAIATLAGIGVSTGLTETLPHVAAYLSSPVTWVIQVSSYLMYLVPLVLCVSGLRDRMMRGWKSSRRITAGSRKKCRSGERPRKSREKTRKGTGNWLTFCPRRWPSST